MTTTIENRGAAVRGGSNSYARLHLEAKFPHLATTEETRAFAEVFLRKLGLEEGYWGGNEYEAIVDGPGRIYFRITNRRQFALVPAFIRLTLESGGDILVQLWDVKFKQKESGYGGLGGHFSLATDPGEFWREVALAQMFCGS